ncbi:MAG: hypothetical protein COW01_12600 [Bdellovibrionales bacterium CG12_big_fil_rev_8_21_14_0_65_38_15]|nr:MAG: hypothetical protein COW79_13915 [Bdellovibrionales bacterium CG22_combo_CG10-13_8_21_14_all_38_13]PIQ53830.1 MAG: hypothetical protein COW01_12600 [Bdellovibrionales bacterium CG12_big_fil_rev_8_21_14_0_65_38_15]PIR30889.1 MAG: hypothetical protein COV38_03225 [Bdellovibrionales bacterium CG11_big_fil_rev_8_21_14_0_20_38_13]
MSQRIGVKDLSNKLTFQVKVKPASRSESIEKDEQGIIVVKIRAKPVDGEANKAVIEALSHYFKIAKSKITLESGPKSKLKRFAISFHESHDDKEKRLTIENFLND